MKCTDVACCSPFQSSYLKVIKDRFLPPPIPVVYSQNGIEWAKDDKEASYLSLFQNIALQASLTPKQAIKKFHKGIPYDYSCPSKKGCTHRPSLLPLWLILWKYKIERKPLVVLSNKGRGEYSSCHKKSSTTKSSSPPPERIALCHGFPGAGMARN